MSNLIKTLLTPGRTLGAIPLGIFALVMAGYQAVKIFYIVGWPHVGDVLSWEDAMIFAGTIAVFGICVRELFNIERTAVEIGEAGDEVASFLEQQVDRVVEPPRLRPKAEPTPPLKPRKIEPAPAPGKSKLLQAAERVGIQPPPPAIEPKAPGYKPPVQSRHTAIDTLARTLWAECRGEPEEGQVAVAEVIVNRTRKPRRFAPTIEAVCLAPWQFSCWNEDGPTVSFDDPSASEMRLQIEIATNAVDGLIDCVLPTGTDHYYAPAGMVPAGSVAYWAEGKTPCAEIGGHLFFNDIE